MLQTLGDIWQVEADYKCVTTNGYINDKGMLVMGRGVAFQAKEEYGERIAYEFAELIGKYGHRVNVLEEYHLISFPTKHHWREDSDIDLIRCSAKQLEEKIQRRIATHVWSPDVKILLPRPGCGNGGLRWELVKKVIEPILGNNVIIISKEA